MWKRKQPFDLSRFFSGNSARTEVPTAVDACAARADEGRGTSDDRRGQAVPAGDTTDCSSLCAHPVPPADTAVAGSRQAVPAGDTTGSSSLCSRQVPPADTAVAGSGPAVPDDAPTGGSSLCAGSGHAVAQGQHAKPARHDSAGATRPTTRHVAVSPPRASVDSDNRVASPPRGRAARSRRPGRPRSSRDDVAPARAGR